jgi:hypothetical protein
MGACEGAGKDLMADAFGIVAMVAMAPLIVIQFMGLMYGRKMKVTVKETEQKLETIPIEAAGEIIEFEEEHSDE